MKFYSAGLFAAALNVAFTANAEVLCENQDQTVKIQTFQLSEDAFGFEPVKVAAILKLAGPKSLYTGTAQIRPNRVGNSTDYNLVDDQGTAIEFSTTKRLTYSQCTRVSCDQVITIVGNLEVAGVSHSLTCSSPIF
jgi:hypothetical protein